MNAFYKGVRLDRTSHYDKATKWRVGAVVRPSKDPHDCHGACGVGIHCSPTLLGAVSYQRGPSRYYEVEPGQVLGADDTKVRCNQVRVIRELKRAEIDELAGFKLWEANHPVNPLLNKRKLLTEDEMTQLIKQWASVRDSVWASVWASVLNSVWESVWDSVGASIWASVGASVGSSVRASVMDLVGASLQASIQASVQASVMAYNGGLFPRITSWTYASTLGTDPWRPLLTLWYAGYVPSFDGTKWRLHAGAKAEVVFERNLRESSEKD